MHTDGNLSASSLYLDPVYGVLPQLEKLRSWFETQRSVQFFQASLLLTYDGKARSLSEANVQVRGETCAVCCIRSSLSVEQLSTTHSVMLNRQQAQPLKGSVW